MKIRFYIKITLLYLIVSAHFKTIKASGHENDESKFNVVKQAEGIFTYVEDTILSIYSYTETRLLVHLDGLLKYILYPIFTIPDQLIRQPINIVNLILNAFSWTLNGIVFIFVDIVLHGLYLVLSFVLIKTSFVVNCMLQLLLSLILAIIFVFKTYVIIPYLHLTSFLYRVIILPSFEPVFWTLSYLTIIRLALYVILCMEKEKEKLKNVFIEYGVKVVFIFFFLVISVCYTWVPFCSIILNYVCYPALAPLYYLGTTYMLCKVTLFSRCWYKLLIINGKYECVICCNVRPLVTLFPCKHKAICLKCHNNLLKIDYRCPLCRAKISRHQEQQLLKLINLSMSYMQRYEYKLPWNNRVSS